MFCHCATDIVPVNSGLLFVCGEILKYQYVNYAFLPFIAFPTLVFRFHWQSLLGTDGRLFCRKQCVYAVQATEQRPLTLMELELATFRFPGRCDDRVFRSIPCFVNSFSYTAFHFCRLSVTRARFASRCSHPRSIWRSTLKRIRRSAKK